MMSPDLTPALPPSSSLQDLFRESVEELLRLAAHRLDVKFGIARFTGEEPIVSGPDAPAEEEARLAEIEAAGEALTTVHIWPNAALIRFYAALRLVDSAGRSRGTAGFVDNRAQALTDSRRQALVAVGRALTHVLEIRDLARHQREEYFRALTENVADIILIVGADGRYSYVSAAIEKVLGYKVEERLGRSAFENIHPEDRDRAASLLQVLTARGSFERAQFRFRHKNGSWRLLELHGSNLLQHPEIRGIVVNASDVTDRRRLEQELEQLNRLSRLGRLAAQVAHEFNNVLMGIQPAVDVLRRVGSDNPQIARLTDLITSSVRRGKGITTDILRFGRPAKLSLRPVGTDELFDQTAGEIQSLLPSGITLQLELPPIPLSICGDRQQLAQILINLAINGRDAMSGGGGTLTIGARPGSEHTAHSVAEIPNSDEFIHINVTDTGEGISSEDLPYIFEPLFTTKKTGTGLGLSVVYQVVTGHGGHIFVETKRGLGTTFHLFIPRALNRRPGVRGERVVAPAALPKLRVLLVEDEVNVATGLRWVLEAEGMTVHVVGRAADVMPAIDEFHPHVMLLDLSLPDSDGRTVYEQVSGRGLPVIFSTGSLGARDLIESGHGGMAVLMKPYAADDLLRAIYEVLPAGGVQ